MYRFREMVEMDGGATSNPPQPISDMFQKFAVAFKAKTYELFADDDADDEIEAGADVTLLLDSAEEFIPDQKVVVIKADAATNSVTDLLPKIVPSLFAVLSSFEASYLQFQAAHVPEIDRNALESADKSLVSSLQKLTEMRNLYRDSLKRGSVSVSNRGFEFPAGSFWEYRVQENQSKLRVLETMVNSMQSLIDVKDDEVRGLRKELERLRGCNASLSRRLGLKEGQTGSGIEVLLTVRVFDAMLGDSVRLFRCFTKLLIDLMRRAGWDLEEAAESVFSEVDYAKKGHFRYAFMSYVCLRMFQDFDKSDFGLCDGEVVCNGSGLKCSENGEVNGYLTQLIEHVASSPMEILGKEPKSEFSRFCERKYDELIHPTMESSIFCNLDKKEKVLKSWKSLSVFYDSYVRMASSIWLLHKLAYSFSPAVEVFQVERGVEFSVVYMEDVLSKVSLVGKTRPRVGFTVVPGFKVGRTIIQAQVYLTESKQAE